MALIVIDLQCEEGHGFEGWFASSGAFEEQLAQGLIACPSCGNARIRRRPSAPYVQTRRSAEPSPPPSPAAIDALTQQILVHLRQTARGMEDVGERFAEEARRIHYGDSESRGIKGRADGEELRELLDEGILVLPIPPDEDLH